MILLFAAFSFSCMREEFAGEDVIVSGESFLQLDFGAQNNGEVQTRATVDEKSESQIYNFCLFVFDKSGAKVTGQYFDASSQKESKGTLETSISNCWYVHNATTNDEQTAGTVRVKTANGTGMSIYMIANLDADMVRVSEELLAHNIQNESDLKKFNVYLNQRIVNRNGYFPMTGKISGVTVNGREDESRDIEVTLINRTMSLRRIDAKVRFIFKTGNRPDENGQVIKSFEAKQWKVVNVPRTSYLLSYEDRGFADASGHDFISVGSSVPASEYSDYAKDFFDTDFVNFEEFPSGTESRFSFYMLENRQTPKKPLACFQDRSRSLKNSDGTNGACEVSYVLNGEPFTRQMRLYEYANDFSTYVVVTGRVEMELKNDKSGQVLGGDVQYIIHLGDWNSTIYNSAQGDGKDTYSGYDNFNTERNTSYTYTVTVNSVNSIRVEVESSQPGYGGGFKENQPGASGAVTVAKEEIVLCDCHYVSRTISFKLSNFFEGSRYDRQHCIIDKLTWSVKTPFGEGEPIKNGMDVTTGLDYKWVHFRLNKKNDDGTFSENRRKFVNRQWDYPLSERHSASDNKEGDGTTMTASWTSPSLSPTSRIRSTNTLTVRLQVILILLIRPRRNSLSQLL